MVESGARRAGDPDGNGRYDRDGDQHYDVASALIKSVRGSDVDAALHYLARMVEAGRIHDSCPPAGDPWPVRMSAWPTVGAARRGGSHAGRVVDRAPGSAPDPGPAVCAPGAGAQVQLRLPRDQRWPRKTSGRGCRGRCPSICGTAATGAADYGHGVGCYPHDSAAGVVPQQYAPESVGSRRYYQPGPAGPGAPRPTALARINAILHPDTEAR